MDIKTESQYWSENNKVIAFLNGEYLATALFWRSLFMPSVLSEFLYVLLQRQSNFIIAEKTIEDAIYKRLN